jgi:hypothetical protein
MLKIKSTGKSYHTIDGVKIQKVSRYYVSREGGVLKKHMPPLPKKVKLGDTSCGLDSYSFIVIPYI